MARITVEDCLQQVNNRFALIHLAAKRVRQLRKGSEPLLSSKNKDIVVALREIAARKIGQVDRSAEHPLLAEALEGGIEEAEPAEEAKSEEQAAIEEEAVAPETQDEETEAKP
jgi:DNA-directed RNA polymerase subunit omega